MNLMQRGIAIAALVTVLSAVSVTGFSVTGLSVTGFGSGTVRAQTVDDGVVWAFAQEEPFVDERVAPYKKVREVAFVEAIPKNPSGKILRRELKEKERSP